jgi:predicted  nucleic acid-binding Zn-ribbon protein
LKYRRKFQHRKVKIWCLDCGWENYTYHNKPTKDHSSDTALYHHEHTGHRVVVEKIVRGVYENS